MAWFTDCLCIGAAATRALVIVSFLSSSVSIAQAADFPGKGNRLLWGYALQNYDLANRYMNQERYEEAIDQYNQAITRYEFDPDFYANLGVAYTKIGNYPAAELTLKKASQLNSTDWVPWSNLANIYAKQNKLKEALPIFEQALKCNPPKAESDPIKNNIAGIKRILNAQAKFQAASTTKTATATLGKKDALKPGRMPPQISQKNSAPTSRPEMSSATQDRESLKKSGWDWSY